MTTRISCCGATRCCDCLVCTRPLPSCPRLRAAPLRRVCADLPGHPLGALLLRVPPRPARL
eukprot:5811359-Pyramimonas_sp.AAC.1